jgi:hypothetical protein
VARFDDHGHPEGAVQGRAAEAMIGEVREDDPLLAEELRVEAIELG